ncbi:YceI family protein [Williamwhitmania taraxaci]|uniref:Polyisoprenoid-binding protein YceI n=1 Tax=Williamwhitmania taraxaci TaxID=1640674 RepID=A0A1G6LSW6_9BACT|nr:YceI family protein [Williamwhitmania taraxaci]SDC46194.1 Polyisoprenoid-binding protein YceI [Williamwhitmania taraxaci]
MLKKSLLLATVFCLAFVQLGIGQTSYNLKSYKITIKGTSNLHDWSADVKKMGVASNLNITEGSLSGITTAMIDIDAATLEASEGSIMSGKMRSALNAEKYPKITFSASNLSIPAQASGEFSTTIMGNLTISGTTQKVSLPVKVRILANGEVEFSGSQKFKMTSFKVTPPTAMFGAMKTGDEVNIVYLITLKKG